jgi:pSer/pThr/pTyr-binding forkhead associated (FHA) protein
VADLEQFSAKLVAEDGTEHELSGEMKVGRVAACEITIEDPRISRAHAMIRVVDERVTVEDLGSANGSRINDVLADGEAELSNGDILSFENHRLTVVITVPQEEEETDMTIISVPEPEPDNDMTMVGGYTAPEPPPAAEPAPPAPEPAPEPAAAPKPARAAGIPDSWHEDPDDGEHTQILMPGAAPAASMADHVHERESDMAHLQVVVDGVSTDLFELAVSDGTEPDVWEVGRSESCQIALEDPSVSTRHAQLIHQSGRWRMVNLVSSNGIYVNDEKRLTAYLGDNDKIRLGMANLVFRTAVGAAAAPQRSAGPSAAEQTGGAESAGGNKTMVIVGAVVAVVAIAAAAAFFLL